MQRSGARAHLVVAGLLCGPVTAAVAAGAEPDGPGATQLRAAAVDLAGVRPLTLTVMQHELAARLADAGLSFRWRRAAPRDEIAREARPPDGRPGD